MPRDSFTHDFDYYHMHNYILHWHY